jgi:hypothetical protein
MTPHSTRFTGDAGVAARGLTRYRVHLPIYNGLISASIGAPVGFRVLPDDSNDGASGDSNISKAIVWYGTSIVNGHVASRPGMIFTNALSRLLGRAVINLGFGGNGEMERSVGALIAHGLRGAAMVVVDCNWNMNATGIRTNAVSIVRQLRSDWSPTKPLLLAEGHSGGAFWLHPADRAAQVRAVTQLQSHLYH